MRPLLAILLLALASFLRPQAGHAQAGETSPTLIVAVADFDGNPVKDVPLSLEIEGSPTPVQFKTDENGYVSSALPSADAVALVALADNTWMSPQPAQTSTRDARALFFRVYAASSLLRPTAESRSLARDWGRIIASDAAISHDPEVPGPSAPPQLTPVRAAAFVSELRRDVPDPPALPPDYPTAQVAARLVDSLGSPVADQLIYLYLYGEDAGTLRLVGFERTDREGQVIFEDAPAASWGRVECTTPDGRVARSTLLYLAAGQTHAFPPLSLRSPDTQLTGFLFLEGAPVAGCLVHAGAEMGRPALTTSTDASGYFQIAPLGPGESVTLEFTRASVDGPRTGRFEATAGEGELLLPLDLLMSD